MRARKAVNIPSRHQYNAKAYSAASATSPAACSAHHKEIMVGEVTDSDLNPLLTQSAWANFCQQEVK
jgi:hypothetical protein